jgi:hypothetical protein
VRIFIASIVVKGDLGGEVDEDRAPADHAGESQAGHLDGNHPAFQEAGSKGREAHKSAENRARLMIER